MKEALEFLKSKDNFLILTHINPDGDALGSAFSLTAGLRTIGKNAITALLAPIPDKYDFKEFEPLYLYYRDVNMADFDNVISVDCGDIKRLGEAKEAFERLDSLNIDHHISNDAYADVNYIEDCAATGEIIYELLRALNAEFDKAARLGIYTAIVTDSGNLTFSNTTARSFNICAKMVNLGLNIPYAAGKIFNTRSLGATKLIALYIENLKLYNDGKISVSSLSLEEISGCGAKAEDCETLINYGKDIESVEVTIFIRELNRDKYKLSMRSKTYADVGQIAANFGGGGHAKAAGCMVEGKYDEVERMVLDTVREYIR